LEIDPNNAWAHVGVANVWALRYQLGWVQRQEAMPLYKAALDKALELDNTLSDAHSLLADYRCYVEWDWENAEKEHQQALRLNPNNSGAHASYSHLLCIMGRKEEALPHIERALELDPLNPFRPHFYGMVMGFHRRYDDALAAFRTVLEIDPSFEAARGGVTNMLYLKGKHDEAFAIWRERFADDAEITAALEDGFEKAGYKGAFRAIADFMAKRYGKPGERGGTGGIAGWYIRAGDYEEAIDWLEKAYEEHRPGMPYIGLNAPDPMRSNPRFQELLRKMNLPVDEKE
jgi:tetratricopeptide (TPR) repeat protein